MTMQPSLRASQFRTDRLQSLTKLSGLALVICAAALWATVGVASELVPERAALPREAYGFARTLIAGPVILLFLWAVAGTKAIRVQPGSTPQFLLFGICCAIFQIGLFRSFDLIGVTITVFLTVCLPPVIAIACATLRQTERVPAHVLGAFVLAAAGLLTFVGGDHGEASRLHVLEGLALSVIASVAFVQMTTAGRTLALTHSPMLVAGLGLLAAAAVLFPVTLLMVPVDASQLMMSLGSGQTPWLLLYLGLGPTALAYICYCRGMARCESAIAGLVASMIEPAIAACLAFVLLNETLTAWQMLGCLAILASMLLLARRDRVAKPSAS